MRTGRCGRDHKAIVGVIAGAALLLSGFGAQAASPGGAGPRTVGVTPLGAAAEPALFVRPASASPTPRVTLFTAIPATVAASGGKVRLLADVENAKLCRFSATPHLPALSATHDCATGVASVEVELARNATSAEQTYRFKLAISGADGSKTAAVLVHVRAEGPSRSSKGAAKAPAITTQPRSEAVAAGQSTSFKAVASGTPTPKVKWQLSTNAGGNWTNIAGAHSATYSFVASASQNANEYRAVFTNAAGSAKTHAATLTITAAAPSTSAPSITSEPLSESVVAGASATFTAAASGNPAPTVQWQQSTNGGTTWSPITGATTTTYSFSASSAQNGYEYRAVFSNGVGSAATTSAATLTVTTPQPSNAAPSITAEPVSATVAAGTSATFTAAASGTPTPTVQWQQSTNGGTTWSPITGATATTYSFTASSGENAYQYRAVFSNGVGSPATTNAATLTVTTTPPGNSAPAITTQPTNQIVLSGNSGTFTAAASGSPTPTVQWQVSTDGGGTWGNVAGATSTTYSLPAATSESGYQFRAVFSNGVGSSATTDAATLTVEAEASYNWSGYVAAGSSGEFTSVSASWTVSSVSCGGDATTYSSQWVGIDGNASDSVEQDGTEADCSSGRPVYDAWYEMYGDDAVADGNEVELSPSQYPIAPGDAMRASVSVSGTNWTLTIADNTHPWSGGAFSTNISFSGGDQSSAEWIVERPETCSPCSLADLSDFGTASFTSATATTTDDGSAQSIAALDGSSIEMLSANGDNPVLAAPSALDATGEEFTDTWYGSD
jgi:hypothetical protein